MLFEMWTIGFHIKVENRPGPSSISVEGCMFPSDVMLKQKTRNGILGVKLRVRDTHGWYEEFDGNPVEHS